MIERIEFCLFLIISKMELKHGELTDVILKVFYEVYNELGYGFLEKVYQNAVYIELKNRGYFVETQKKIKVFYKGNVVGEYYADLVVNNLVIFRIKSSRLPCGSF